MGDIMSQRIVHNLFANVGDESSTHTGALPANFNCFKTEIFISFAPEVNLFTQ